MTKETKIRVLRIYSILLGIVIVIAGICLMAGCLSIYNSGDQPYSREIVAETFSHIAIPVYLCLGMTILGFILEIILPSEQVKPQVEKPYAFILNRLHSNRDLSQGDAAIQNEIAALQKNRKLHVLIRTIVLIVASIVFLTYALNFSHFHASEINGSMIKAMCVLVPCLFVSFAYALFVSIHNDKSIQKEIELMKQIPASSNKEGVSEDSDSCDIATASESKKLRITRCVILAIGVFFLVYGYMTGGIADVLAKAINICTECIGLG